MILTRFARWAGLNLGNFGNLVKILVQAKGQPIYLVNLMEEMRKFKVCCVLIGF